MYETKHSDHGDSKCSLMIPNCLDCDQQSQSCIQCVPGYTLHYSNPFSGFRCKESLVCAYDEYLEEDSLICISKNRALVSLLISYVKGVDKKCPIPNCHKCEEHHLSCASCKSGYKQKIVGNNMTICERWFMAKRGLQTSELFLFFRVITHKL
jgi:hypothetical protein